MQVESETGVESPRWRLLSPDTAGFATHSIELASRPRAVLLSLLLQPNEFVSTERLVERLWGDAPPKTARNSIARFVADLRGALGPLATRVLTEPGGYRLHVEPGELDVDEVTATILAAQDLAGDELDDAHERVTAARALFHGDSSSTLLDLTDTEADTRRHEELHAALIEIGASLQLRRGNHHAVIADLETAVDRYPFHEQLWAQLMQALYRANRQADALRAYQRLAVVLDDIGLLPAPPLRRLEAEILAQLDVGGDDGVGSDGDVGIDMVIRVEDSAADAAGVDAWAAEHCASATWAEWTHEREYAATFANADDALAAVRVLGSTAPGLRAGVHAGSLSSSDETPTRELARAISTIAQGGRTLVAEAVAEVLGYPDDLAPVGAFELRAGSPPEPLWELGVAPLSRSRAPAAAAGRHGLAQPRTSLIGRSTEAHEIKQAIEMSRLVSIVGIGGSGKTRMAVVAANAAARDGTVVHTVALRTIDEPSRLLPTVAAVLGLHADVFDENDPSSVGRAIGDHEMLLVLDNCEQMLEATAALVDAVLDHAPDVRVLVTSREPLRTGGEFVYRLAPLATPDHDDQSVRSPALALFIERARAQVNWLEPTADTRREIGAICRALDGLPLAIELAAVQLVHLSPAELLERITERGAQELTDSRGTAALAAVLEWTWESLTEDQQTLLARLTVFGGSWSLDAAEAVCGDGTSVTADLAELVNKSLVSMNPVGGRARYEMLETVREMARDRLDERGERLELCDRMVTWLEQLARAWSIPELTSWAVAIETMASEHDNILVALTHLTAQDRNEEAAWLAVRTAGFWIHHGFPAESRRWLLPLADDDRLSTAARSAAAAVLMDTYSAEQKAETMVQWGLRSLELADGEPHEWIPHVAAVLGLLALTYSLPFGSAELFSLAREAAAGSASESTSTALVDVWEAQTEFACLDFDASLARFRHARATCDEPGRILMFAEIGEALSLLLLDRRDEARLAVDGWQSDSATDEWHYIIDIVRAIVRARSGAPVEATEELAAVVNRLRPASVAGRSMDFQTAFGLLAFERGDVALSEELLATPMPQNALLLVAMIHHIARQRGVVDETGWLMTSIEVISRVGTDDLVEAPVGARRSVDLVEWWATGAPHA